MDHFVKSLKIATCKVVLQNLNMAYGKSQSGKVRDAILADIAKAKIKLSLLKE